MSVTWWHSGRDTMVHAADVSPATGVTAALCTHSVPDALATPTCGPTAGTPCLTCLLLVGDLLATDRHDEAARWAF